MSDLQRQVPRVNLGFLAGDGEMVELIRSKDWKETPLGPIESWPQSLRTSVSLCLASNFPINVVWGSQHTQIYNDGYRVLCGKGHPAVLGSNYAVYWASAWSALGQPFDLALGGETSFLEDQRMFLERNGYLEETFFTFSLSPIRDESGHIGGLLLPAIETTATMVGVRRTRAIQDLTVHLGDVASSDQVFTLAADTLASFPFDLPFVLFYQLDKRADVSPSYRLAAHTGLPAGTAASPIAINSTDASPWPITELVRSPAAIRLVGLRSLLGPCGPYEEPPDAAFALPIRLPGLDLPAAVVVAGASSRLPIDDAYSGFYDLIAAAIGTGLARAGAQEEERRRVEALAAIDRAKTTFFSNVSHEFRTPLTLMLGPIEDLLDEAVSLPPAQRERLEVAHRNALRLLKLVNSLLDFSRIEAAREQARFEPVDIAALTAALASNFRSACERAGLDLVVDCPPLDAPVYVDPDMWEKIVLNLVSNAFKFTLRGSVTVALRKTAAMAELVVRDTGVGIPAHELPRVFERFHRIEGQRARTHEGTGIGLALVVELVKMHGGSITASSVPEQGTEFRVTIPLGSAHLPRDYIYEPTLVSKQPRASAFVEEALRWLPDQAGVRPSHSRGESGLTQMEDKPRILLADDNADMRAYVAGILARGGYDVEAVEDGAAALAAARRGPLPDLILTDVMMPGLDGFALLREVRADPAMEGLPVILLSARAGEEARIDGLAAGADDYLTKPFGARELRARIDGAIRLARLRAQQREDLENFARVLAHDLRSPFASLQLFVQAMAEEFSLPTIDKDEVLDQCKEIFAAAGRASDLIDDVFEYTRADAQVEFATVDMTQAAKNAAADLKKLIEERKAQVTRGELPAVMGNASQLTQLLQNLIANAIKFCKAEPPQVHIAARPDQAKAWLFSVKDNGIGIDAKDFTRIFQPFKRLHTAGEFEGTGLGLGTCKKIVERHGGAIWCESVVGEGTTFFFTLAAVQPEPASGSANLQSDLLN